MEIARIQITSSGGGYDVAITSVAGSIACRGTLSADLSRSSRLASVITQVARGPGRLEDLKDIGSQLWDGLLIQEAREYLEKLVKGGPPSPATSPVVNIDIPDELNWIPWEALYDERTAQFVAVSNGIVRGRLDFGQSTDMHRSKPIRMLVAIPDGSDLDVEREWQNIKRVTDALGDSVQCIPLKGRVTIESLDEAFRRGNYQIFHFIGHGEADDFHHAEIRLNDDSSADNENWVDAETFATLFTNTSIRLAVLNCCLAAHTSQRARSLSPLGPMLLRHGVEAVVAMQYEIPDDLANRFANQLYKEFFGAQRPGSICFAVSEARRTIRLRQREGAERSFASPVLYLASARDPLFDITPRIQTPVPKETPKISLQLPPELVDSVREGRCIPVLGPGLLERTPQRRGTMAPGPLHLARLLAAESEFPEMQQLDLADSLGEWYELLLLQRVCQHYERKKRRFRLTERIADLYRKGTDGSVYDLMAAWTVSGAFCTYFDAGFAAAYDRAKKDMREIDIVTDNVDPLINAPLVVNLRGSCLHQKSLVLSEQDHDRVARSISRMTPAISGLVDPALGRTLLFLGVSPRDNLIRQVCQYLLNPQNPDIPWDKETIYFVCKYYTEVDEAYWMLRGAHWITAEPGEVVHSVSASL